MPARSPLIACFVLAASLTAAPTTAAGVPVDLPGLLPGLPGVPQLAGGSGSITRAVGVEPAMVAEVNRVRAQHGLPPFRFSASLRRSAHRYAGWMLRADFFGHQGRIRASRRYRRLGEALSLHRGWRAQVRRTVQRWLRSPGHRSLVLSRGFRHLGAGRARGSYAGGRDTTWVLHLGG